MTIELRRNKEKHPYSRKVQPVNCLSDLGYFYIHSQETFRSTEAARLMNNKDYSFVLQPKIMTSDESLHSLDPQE